MRSLVTVSLLFVSLLAPAQTRAQGYGFAPSAAQTQLEAELAASLARVEQTEASKARLEAEAAGLGDRRDEARRRLRTRTSALYRLRRSGMLPLAGGFTALLAHVARVERLERMVVSDARALGTLATRAQALRAERAEASRRLEAARARLQALEQRRATAEAEQRVALFDGAFDPAGTPSSYYGSGQGYLRVVGETSRDGFVLRRGRLGMPVAGAADVREGRRGESGGMEFLVRSGTIVRAVHDGRVAFAERYADYGSLVIVDHGEGYFTVYGGMGRIDVRVGDPVASGGTLGVVGEDGPTRGLFFEVRRGTRALDAPSWLGL